jgi:cell division protein FtsQ
MKGIKYNNAFAKNLAWLVLFFLAVSLMSWAVSRKQAKVVGDLLIEVIDLPGANNLITKEDIAKRLEKSFVIKLSGMPIGALDVKKIEAVLEEDPFVKDAEVFITAKNKVVVEVEQRAPWLRIIDVNGEHYYLDEAGMKMPLSKHYAAKVLVATGSIPPYIPDFMEKPKHALRDLVALSKRIVEDDFLEPLVAQIYRNEKGSFTLVPIVGNQNIILGPYEDVEEKFFRLEQFYLKAIPYTGWNKYKTINLTFKNQVVCEKR